MKVNSCPHPHPIQSLCLESVTITVFGTSYNHCVWNQLQSLCLEPVRVTDTFSFHSMMLLLFRKGRREKIAVSTRLDNKASQRDHRWMRRGRRREVEMRENVKGNEVRSWKEKESLRNLF